MKLLILTQAQDTHAVMVQLALEKMNHHVQLLCMADQPTKLTNSVFINNENFEWKRVDNYTLNSGNNYDIVWWRRSRKPKVPKNIIHSDDYKFASRENDLFYESITSTMAPNAWWINSKVAAARANYKLLQLKKASECKLSIPPSLYSNNVTDIHSFVLNHEAEGVIYKPFCSNVWFENKGIRFGYTSKITLADLPQDELLQCVPGIFQQQIKKKYELRITCFGDYIVAAKLDSQACAEGKIDWRAIPADKLFPKPYQLPCLLADKIRLFMKKMGIVFGALDFIVTENDEYVFLEVNEQGQFLWLENCNSDFKMLDIFIGFILNKSAKYEWKPHSAMHSFSDFKDKTNEIISAVK